MDANARRALENLLAQLDDPEPRLVCEQSLCDPLVERISDLVDEVVALRREQAAIRRRLDGFVDAAMAYAQGNYDTRIDEESGDDQIDAAALGLNMMAEEVRASTAALAQARDAALAANTAKSAFLASMSHELRTPLSAIMGYAELLLEHLDCPTPEPEILRHDLQRVLMASQQLLGLITDVLDLSKIESGRMELAPSSVDVATLCRELVDTVAPQADRRGNQIRLQIAPDLPALTADTVRLRQILLNLLSNAVKFTERGTIEVAISHFRERSYPWIRFAVTDTGTGIPQHRLRTVFEPFVQAHTGHAAELGTGLGLAIARRFCRLMGGEIAVRSQVGVGSTFEVTLPAGVPTRAPGPSTPSADPLVLVVDDDPTVHELIRRNLANQRCTVLGAHSGREALALVQGHKPAVIVLDVRMPDMDGFDTLTALKSDPDTADIPVVFLSMVDDRSRGVALGATDYLLKPVRRETLLKAVEPYLTVSGSTALVVDDDADARTVAERLLSGQGWTVRTAANGREALEQLAESRPDVVLLDLMMPEMDGFAVIEHLRSSPTLADLPLVVLTAAPLTPRERDELRRGVQFVLEKGSVDSSELLAHLTQTVARTAHRARG